jgi:DNA-binding XRE family transcriptional regulator
MHSLGMKPFELVAALMHREGLGPLPLAKKIGKAKLQPQIHRFSRGEVANPDRTTAVPIAEYFNIPVEAIYDERIATEVARELGITAIVTSSTSAPRKRPSLAHSVSQSNVKLAAKQLDWGALMEGELPATFEVAVPDDAMAPRVRAGQIVKFDTRETPRPGDGVLVVDSNGEWFFRLYRQGRRGAWEAAAENAAFETLQADRDGLKVVAVLVGVQARWG